MASADGKAPPSERESTAAPTECVAGCGFFGNPTTGNMCSKCWKDNLAKSAAATPPPAAPVCVPVEAPAAAPTPPTPPPAAPVLPAVASPAPAQPPATASPAAAGAASPPAAVASASTAQVRPPEDEGGDEPPPKKVQVNTNRCWTCNRKIGLTGFQCKCEYFFCADHRYSDRHQCSFDFKAQGKQFLTKANPTIAPSKVDKL